jgi:hypothetical protein
MREKAIAIAGLYLREKRTHPLHERLRDLMYRKTHLPSLLHACFKNNLSSYELENNITYTDNEWTLAEWQQLDD